MRASPRRSAFLPSFSSAALAISVGAVALSACGGESETDLFGQASGAGGIAGAAGAGPVGGSAGANAGASGTAGKSGGAGAGAGGKAGAGGSTVPSAGASGASGASGGTAGAAGSAGVAGAGGIAGAAGGTAGAAGATTAGSGGIAGAAGGEGGAAGASEGGAAGAAGAGAGEGGAAGSAGGDAGAGGDSGAAGAAGSPVAGAAGAAGAAGNLCGNGVIDPGEKCDGTELGGTTCASLLGGTNVGKLQCRADCSFDTVQCGHCGNGILDPGEECEDGPDVASGRCKACKIACPDDGKAFAGHCYSEVTGYKNWDDANKECANRKAHLVSITSADENKFVHEVLIGKQQFDPRTLWIGLTDQSKEGTFEWTTKEPLSYKNWDNNEPNDFLNNEDCGTLGTNNGKWNDERCTLLHQAVCEIDEPLKK